MITGSEMMMGVERSEERVYSLIAFLFGIFALNRVDEWCNVHPVARAARR